MPIIPFPDYLPDLPVFQNPGSINILNVKPAARSYTPHGALGTYSTGALTARCQGAHAFRDDDGSAFIYAGDATKLYNLNSSTLAWTNVTRVSGAYATGAEESPGWRFLKFENQILATNFADDLQTSTFGGANFTALGGSPPKARYITRVRNRILVGNTFDTADGNVPNRIRWTGLTTAGLPDETAWTVSATTTADFQDLQDEDGPVQGVFGGEYAVILQEKGVTRLTFSGIGTVFQADRVEGVRGCFVPGSAIQYDDVVFYLSEDGFYAFDGVQSHAIGANKVDKTILADLDTTNHYRMTAAVDPINKFVYWAYPGSGNASGMPNKMLIYDVVNRKWAPLSGFELAIVFTAMTLGVSPDAIDAIQGFNGDTWTFSPDSRVWTGGKFQLAAMTTAHKLGFFDGANLEATLDTAEHQLFDGRRSFVTGARPIVDGGTVTVTPIHRALPTDSLTTGSAASVNGNGLCPLRINNRYVRFRTIVAAGGSWTHAQGIEVESRPEGRR